MEKELLSGKADLHVHSKYSRDGFSSVKDILENAKKRGMDVIAITDHNTIEGAKEAQKIASGFGVEVVIGEEMDAKEGDVIGLFLKEAIKPKMTVLETVREIHSQGGLTIIPHPGNWSLRGVSLKVLSKIFEEVDAIETLNASWAGRIRRGKAKKFNKELFHLAETGGSDSHIALTVGRAYASFQGKTSSDLYNAIKNKKTAPGGELWSLMEHLVFFAYSPLRILKIFKIY